MGLPDRKISQKILKDHYNALVFGKGRGNVYLVGGFIRDMVRGARSHDRDYIVFGDIRSFVKQIRTLTGGTVVEFKNEGMIRIALKGGDTLDFSKPQGLTGGRSFKKRFYHECHRMVSAMRNRGLMQWGG